MQVEVCIQDCFHDGSIAEAGVPSGTLDALPETYAIAPETWEIWFQHWLELLNPNFSVQQVYDLTLRLTDDSEIQTLNAQYRNQDKPTDVLAFAALEADCPALPEADASVYLGDIVISVDTAQRQAQQQGHGLQIELAWLASHGLLHLLGWDHPDEVSLIQMLNQQQLLLQTVGLATEIREYFGSR